MAFFEEESTTVENEWIKFVRECNCIFTDKELKQLLQDMKVNQITLRILTGLAISEQDEKKARETVRRNLEPIIGRIAYHEDTEISKGISDRYTQALVDAIIEKRRLELSAKNKKRRVEQIRDQVKTALAQCGAYDSLETVRDAIDSILSKPNINLQRLLEENKLPMPVFPPVSQLSNNFTEELLQTELEGIPAPNFLLHELNRANDQVLRAREAKIKAIHREVDRTRVLAMIGPSGSGKTRTVFEYLSKHFGIFITASTGLRGGSKDFEALLNETSSKILNGAATSDSEEEVTQVKMSVLARSINIVYGFQNIVALRLLFLERLKAKYETLTPYQWLMIQEMPSQLFGQDVFDSLRLTYRVDPGQLENLGKKTALFVDDAHILMRDRLGDKSIACCSGSDLKLMHYMDQDKLTVENLIFIRKPIAPILYAFDSKLVNKCFTLVLSSTCLQVDEFKTGLASAVCKDLFKDICYIKLGSFMRFEDFQIYMHYYLPNLTEKDLERIHGHVKGRYRFTAQFIALYLHHQDIDRAINDLYAKAIDSIQRIMLENCPGETILKKKDHLLATLYNCFWTGSSFDLNNKRVQDAWLIENALGLIDPSQPRLQVFNHFDFVVRGIQVAEPIAFEVINGLLFQTDRYIKNQYPTLSS